jgi:hypothetical protein
MGEKKKNNRQRRKRWRRENKKEEGMGRRLGKKLPNFQYLSNTG